jgi:BlaI family transcriptional regulator, penicillinase repressor
MAQQPTISAAEWEVMIVLWNQSPLTAAEVVGRLADRRDWSPRTIKTLLNRLTKKRAVGFSAQGKSYLYRPLVARDACVRRESRSFASRVFGGAVGPMLVHFVQQADLTPAEIAEIKQALMEKTRRQEKP